MLQLNLAGGCRSIDERQLTFQNAELEFRSFRNISKTERACAGLESKESGGDMMNARVGQ